MTRRNDEFIDVVAGTPFAGSAIEELARWGVPVEVELLDERGLGHRLRPAPGGVEVTEITLARVPLDFRATVRAPADAWRKAYGGSVSGTPIRRDPNYRGFADQEAAHASLLALSSAVALPRHTLRNPGGELPAHPDNLLVVRPKPDLMDSSYLYYLLLYLWESGELRRLATGTAQQCIRAADIKNLPVAREQTSRRRRRPMKLKDVVDVVTYKSTELEPGDVLVQRVGTEESCGHPFLVVAADPLVVRNRSKLRNKLMRG